VDAPAAGLTVLAIALALGWLIGRRRLIPATSAVAGEQLAGLAAALVGLGVLAVTLALAKPYALVFVLPSLYAWMWLPLRSRLWPRALFYSVGLAGPLLGLALLGRQLDLGALDIPLYVTGLTTVGYLSAGSVLASIVWAAAAAQLAALAFGRYAPYAQGTEPPPAGFIRRAVRSIARARSRV
jgi:hypothetical protein